MNLTITLLFLFFISNTLFESKISEYLNISLLVSDIFRLSDHRIEESIHEFNSIEGDSIIEIIHSDFLMLYTDRSNIENGGNGVFAKEFIAKNSIICEYRGPVINSSDESKLPYNDKYFGIKIKSKNFSVLGENICAFINDCSNAIEKLRQNNTLLYENDHDQSECYENLSYNAVALAIGSKIFVLSSRDIFPNEEIFYSYKWPYWKDQFLRKETFDESYANPIFKILT